MELTEQQQTDLQSETISNGQEPENDFSLEIKYNGEAKTLSKEEAVSLAQKGMNYDHVYNELLSLRQSGDDASYERKTNAPSENQTSDQKRNDEFTEFFIRHNELNGVKDIPEEVVCAVADGQGIEEAYLSYENRRLKSKLKEFENAGMTPGTLGGGGAGVDDFVSMLLAKL